MYDRFRITSYNVCYTKLLRDDVEAYVNRVANKFKREQIVDAKTGNVDMRFNQMAVDQDYFIPVRDPSAPDPITTLPGATNLSEIADIEYIVITSYSIHYTKLYEIYRTSRAPERRMFKVFVGNMNDDDVEAYVNRVITSYSIHYTKLYELFP